MNQNEQAALGIFFGYRKFMLTLLLLVIGVGFRLAGLIDGAQMVDLLKATSLAFIAGNVGEHATNLGREWLKAPIIADLEAKVEAKLPGGL